MKHTLFLQDLKEVNCCDFNLFDTYKESSKKLNNEVEKIFIQDIDTIYMNEEGEYKIKVNEILIGAKRYFYTKLYFDSKLCDRCINIILWHKIICLENKVLDLKEELRDHQK